MPDQSSNLTTLRTSGSFASVYLSVYRGAEVAEFTVDTTPADQALNLAVTLVDGDGDAVKPGYRVAVFTSGGDFKGRTRVRYGATPSDTVLPIREHSQGVAKIAAGDTIKVYADVRLSDKLVSATAAFAPDSETYSDQGENPPPLACSGGAWAGFASMLPIPFTGSISDYVDPDSNGPLSHAWTFPTGLTADDDDVADVNITDADAGEYLVAHTVTDDDNSKSTTQYVPVIVHDASNPPYEVVVEDVSGDEENGHLFTVRVFEDADLTSIPDGAFCILWMEQVLAGSVQAFGAKSPGRSHILGVGYIRREDGAFDSDDGVESLTFEVISPMARLAELVGYSKVMTSAASPDTWMEMKTLTTERAKRQIWQFYTNATEAGFDFVTDSNYSDALYPELFLQESTPLAQIRELAEGRKARFTCDRTGRFSLHLRPDLIAVSSRASVTKTITLDANDIIGWSYTREHWRPVSLLECRGFTAGASGNAAIFSRWPGLAPGQGNQKVTIERLIESNQGAINVSCGQFGAAADGIYTATNGAMQTALDLELTLPTGYHVADFYDEYVAIELTTEMRGLDLSDQLFVLRSVRLETGDDGTLQTVWTLRTATHGTRGVTYHPPAESDNGLPPWTPPTDDWDFPELPVIEPIPWTWEEFPPDAEPIKLFGIGTQSGRIVRAQSFSMVSGATWELINSGASGTPRDACADPYDYRRRFLLTTVGLYKCDDIWVASPVWTLVASAADMTGTSGVYCHQIEMSINRQGYMICAFGARSVAVSFDSGASWQQAAVHGTVDTSMEYLLRDRQQVALSQHNNPGAANQGWVWGTRDGASNTSYTALSKDWGLTWTTLSAMGSGEWAPAKPWIPYMRPGGIPNVNDNSQIAYYVQAENGVFVATPVGIVANLYDGTMHVHDDYALHDFATYTNDANYIVATSEANQVIVSSNGAQSWTSRGSTGSANKYINGYSLWPNDYNLILHFGQGVIRMSSNFGVSWTNLAGNIVSVMGSANFLYAEWDISDYVSPQA